MQHVEGSTPSLPTLFLNRLDKPMVNGSLLFNIGWIIIGVWTLITFILLLRVTPGFRKYGSNSDIQFLAWMLYTSTPILILLIAWTAIAINNWAMINPGVPL